MRTTFGVFALVVAVAALPGCATLGTWWEQFESNPVAKVQAFEQTVGTIESDLQVAFQAIVVFLPSATAAAAQTAFNNGILAINHAEQVLSDAVTAAVDAQSANPDFSQLMQAVTDAVSNVIAIIETYQKAQTPTGASGLSPTASPPGLADAIAAKASLAHFYAGK